MYKVAVVGYGYWGPKIARTFDNNPNFELKYICEPDAKRAEAAATQFGHVCCALTIAEVVDDVDVVAIVTPVANHYALCKFALEHNKHVFIEKPFTDSSAKAAELIAIAKSRNLTIMVDHTFLFVDAVKTIKQLVDTNVLGKLYYYDSVRVNLGLFQRDINVAWDLAPHDLAIVDWLCEGRQPVAVSATGVKHLDAPEDVAYLNLRYVDNFNVHIHCNWLSPVKVRKTLIAGDKKMLVWDDLENDEKLKLYDKGAAITSADEQHARLVSYRSGDVTVPKIDNSEALSNEIAYLAAHLMSNKIAPLINDGDAGLRVVRLLEAADLSIKNGGQEVLL